MPEKKTKALVVNKDGTMHVSQLDGEPPKVFVNKHGRKYHRVLWGPLDGMHFVSDIIEVYEEEGIERYAGRV